MKKKQKAFSLIEMIVSLVISGVILAAIYQVNINMQTVVSKNLDTVQQEQIIIDSFENIYQFLNNAGAYIDGGQALSAEKLGIGLTDDEINIQYDGGKSCISRPYEDKNSIEQTRTLSNKNTDIICTDNNNKDTVIENAQIKSVHYAIAISSSNIKWLPAITTTNEAKATMGVYIRYQYLEGANANKTFGLFSKFNSP